MARSKSTRRGEVSTQSVESAVNSALNEIGQALQKKGIPLEKLIERGREIRGEIIEEKYGFID